MFHNDKDNDNNERKKSKKEQLNDDKNEMKR